MAFALRLGLIVASLYHIELREIGEGFCDVRVIWSRVLFGQSQRAPVGGLSLFMLATQNSQAKFGPLLRLTCRTLLRVS